MTPPPPPPPETLIREQLWRDLELALYGKTGNTFERDQMARLDAFIDRALAARRAEPPQATYPIPLNAAQEASVKNWAADDRLWTTQETVEINLRTFARVILRDAVALPASPPAPPADLVALVQHWQAMKRASLNPGDAWPDAERRSAKADDALLAWTPPATPPVPGGETPVMQDLTQEDRALLFENRDELYFSDACSHERIAVFSARTCETCLHFARLGPSAHGLCDVFDDNRDPDDGCLKGWAAKEDTGGNKTTSK